MSARTEDGVPILDVAGELDLYTSPKLQAALEALLAEGHSCLLVNLLDTTYLDSTALSILSAALQEVRRGQGNIGLIYRQPQVSRIFAITGLAEVFAVFATEAEALVAAKTWAPEAPAN